MGIQRKLKKSIGRIAMADAHMNVNGCQVFLGHPSKSRAFSAAKDFHDELSKVVLRAKSPNLTDIINASFDIRKKMELNWVYLLQVM